MNSNHHDHSEVHDLIDAFLDDRLDGDGHVRLQQLIVADAAARREYVQMMSMLGGIHRFLQGRPEGIGAIQRSGTASSATEPSPAPPLIFGDLDAVVGDPLGAGSDVAEKSTGFGFTGPTRGLLLAACFACGLAIWFAATHSNHEEPIALLSQPGQVPLEVRSVRLDSGTAHLSLPKVGYVIVEGPAEFNLLGPMRARLSKGRIKMRVTEKTGKGFVVETPDGEVTDLGTEFGLNVADGQQTGLVVFEGAVDLRVAESRATEPARVRRFVGGEGALFNKEGRVDRIVSVVTGDLATFNLPSGLQDGADQRVIVNVSDNFRTAETKKFYEIVPHGLCEDALSYADREHQWNGITNAGMPKYLVGADYIKTFNDDNNQAARKIFVTLARPAKLYVFLDVRATVPDWLKQQFRDTGDRIGLDAAPNTMKEFRDRTLMSGAGNSIDEQLAIWECIVSEPGVVALGNNPDPISIEVNPFGPAMYGIAAVPLDVPVAAPAVL